MIWYCAGSRDAQRNHVPLQASQHDIWSYGHHRACSENALERAMRLCSMLLHGVCVFAWQASCVCASEHAASDYMIYRDSCKIFGVSLHTTCVYSQHHVHACMRAASHMRMFSALLSFQPLVREITLASMRACTWHATPHVNMWQVCPPLRFDANVHTHTCSKACVDALCPPKVVGCLFAKYYGPREGVHVHAIWPHVTGKWLWNATCGPAPAPPLKLALQDYASRCGTHAF